MKLVAGSYKLELAQFAELQAFSQFASDLGEETKAKLERGKRLVEMLKQFCGAPMTLSSQVGILSLSNQDVISALAIEDVNKFVQAYLSLQRRIERVKARMQVKSNLMHARNQKDGL